MRLFLRATSTNSIKNTHSFSAVQLFLLQYPESFRNEPTVTECGLNADATEYIHMYNTMRFPLGLVELWGSNPHGRWQKTKHNSLRRFVIEEGRRSDSVYVSTPADRSTSAQPDDVFMWCRWNSVYLTDSRPRLSRTRHQLTHSDRRKFGQSNLLS